LLIIQVLITFKRLILFFDDWKMVGFLEAYMSFELLINADRMGHRAKIDEIFL
jgi:hypothetical protein